MWIDPADPRVMIQSNDGGANVTRDGGDTWSTQNNQPTAELYQVALDDRFPAWAYAGQQDNTTIAVPLLPPFDAPGGPSAFWRDVGGCETGPAVPKPGDPDIVYSNCKGQFGRFNQRTGQEQRYWVGGGEPLRRQPEGPEVPVPAGVPIHVSPHDPNTVYHGSQYLHRTRDGGITWETDLARPDRAFEPDKQVISGTPITRDITGEEYYSTIYAVRESPVKKGVIWTGANDGPVHVTRDGGKTWRKRDPARPGPRRPGPEHRAVTARCRPRPTSRSTATCSTTGSRTSTAPPTTARPGPGSPPAPTASRRTIPRGWCGRIRTGEGLLYAGTEFGMFLSLRRRRAPGSASS